MDVELSADADEFSCVRVAPDLSHFSNKMKSVLFFKLLPTWLWIFEIRHRHGLVSSFRLFLVHVVPFLAYPIAKSALN